MKGLIACAPHYLSFICLLRDSAPLAGAETFIERLIGTVRREYLDHVHVLFWKAVDLERKLTAFQEYYNDHRVHSALGGDTPTEVSQESTVLQAQFRNFHWESQCGGLYQLPVAARATIRHTQVGDVFLKWLLQNSGNPRCVQQVTLNGEQDDCYAEFPVAALQERFDPPDRKFAAVANAHPDKPPVWQAADCKWLDWWPDLHAAGVLVEFLCRDDVCRFYKKKFPGKALPALPQQA